jgi:hypothetical protein
MLPETIRFLVLPVVIGMLSTIVVAFNDYLKLRSQLRLSNREDQLKMAIEVCKKVVSAMDILYANTKHNAWYVVWRKSLPEANCASDKSLLESEDASKWKQYTDALTMWRTQQISFETELKAVFGEVGYEAALFLEIDSLFEESSQKLFRIYYSQKEGEAVHAVFTIDDQMRSKQEFSVILEKTRSKIKILSVTMIDCIQRENVGTLKGQVVPTPEKED